MKKLCLFFLSIFMLMGMSWAGVKVSGVMSVSKGTSGSGNDTIASSPTHALTIKLMSGETVAATGTITAGMPTYGPAPDYKMTPGKFTYEFTNVEAGNYTIKVVGRENESAQTYYEWTSEAITVAAADRVEDILVTPSTEKFYFSVTVKVPVNSGGYSYENPLEGAAVKVWEKTGTEPTDAVTTNSSGVAMILLTYSADATYCVKVTKEGYKVTPNPKELAAADVCAKSNTSFPNLLVPNYTEIVLQEDLGDLVTLVCTLKEGSNTLTTLPKELTDNNGKLVLTDKLNKTHDGTRGDDGKFTFTQVPVGTVTFALQTTVNYQPTTAKCWAVETTGTTDKAEGANGASVNGTVVIKRIAGMVSGKVTLPTGISSAQVKATSATNTTGITASTNSQGDYAIYGLTAGEWTITATSQPEGYGDTKTVTVAADFADKTQDFTLAPVDFKVTVALSASLTATTGTTQLFGTKVKLYKKSGDAEYAQVGSEITLPAEGTASTNLYGDNAVMAKIGDKIKAVYNHADYKPVTKEATVANNYVNLSADGDAAVWQAKDAEGPATSAVALKVVNAKAEWEAAAGEVEAGIKLSWDYPAALTTGWGTDYKVQMLTIYRSDASLGSGSKTTLKSYAGTELSVANLPKSYKDKSAKENGYYNYTFEIRYEKPAETVDTTITYGATPLTVEALTAVYAKEGDGDNAKHTATVTWQYPDALKNGWGTTYKVQRIELRRRDLNTAADDVVLAFDTCKVKGSDGKIAIKPIADVLKSYKDGTIAEFGTYSYIVEIRYERPAATASESVVLDRAPKAPINAVAVWNNTTKKVELTWGYPASLKANWSAMEPVKFSIERRNLASATEKEEVFFVPDLKDSTFEELAAITSFVDGTAKENGRYSYIFSIQYKNALKGEATAVLGVRAHNVINLEAAWVAPTSTANGGVKLTWDYPTELIQGLGDVYKIQLMSIERRDMKTPADMETMMIWGKERFASSTSELPKEFFDETAAADGNYNYIVRIRYEEPASTVETFKNINMSLYGVKDLEGAWTAAADGKKAGMKLEWDYEGALRQGLGTSYKLIDLQIVRRDLATAYDYTTVATYAFRTVTAPTTDGGEPTIDYMTDQANLPVEFLDTVDGVSNNGNYSYIFTLRYAQPEGQVERVLKIDQRAEVTLAYSVNDATLGSIVGTTAGKYRKGDLISLKAVVKEGVEAEFSEWKNDNGRVSTDAEYSFIIMDNTTLVAVFTKPGTPAEALALINTTATWNEELKRVDLSWDYPQAVKDGFGVDYKIQKIDIYRVDASAGAASQVTVGYFNSFTTVENLPTTWYDTTMLGEKTYNYTFSIRYEKPVGTKDTTVSITTPKINGGEIANEDVEAASWMVYSHNGVIEMNGMEGAYTYMVYDMNGRVVAKGQYNGASHAVRVENKGMYVVRRVSANGVSAKKVMVM